MYKKWHFSGAKETGMRGLGSYHSLIKYQTNGTAKALVPPPPWTPTDGGWYTPTSKRCSFLMCKLKFMLVRDEKQGEGGREKYRR